MKKDDRLYLDFALECIDRIESYVEGGRESFDSDRKTQDAVLRNLHTLTESTMRLSKELREAHSHIPWKEIAGFRQVVVHDYLDINLDITWNVITRNLPTLKVELQHILASLGG